MTPCPWEPTGWRYPFLHKADRPDTKDHITKRKVLYKEIANEKLSKTYYKTSYSSQFKEKVGFPNKVKKMQIGGSGIHDTDRINLYRVEKGVPESSTLISQ